MNHFTQALRCTCCAIFLVSSPFGKAQTNPEFISRIDSNTQSSYLFAGGTKSISVGNVVYFPATHGPNERGLWRSDGTANGTFLIKSLGYNDNTFFPQYFTKVGSSLFFTTNNGGELWKTDGTTAGTICLGRYQPFRNLTAVGNLLFFTSNDTLFRTDGTVPGTVAVKGGIINSARNEQQFAFVEYNNLLYFNGYDPVNGEELWKSDGTPSGTTLVKNTRPGSSGSTLFRLTKSGNRFFFIAATTNIGIANELWKSDGTDAGTVLVKTFADISVGSYTAPGMYDAEGILYLAASSTNSGTELWRSDGTTAGTNLIKDIYPGTTGSIPTEFVKLNNSVFFTANHPASGRELWKTDGSEAGTVIVKDVNPGTTSSDPLGLFVNNGKLFFSSSNSSALGRELWKSEGDSNNTVLIKNINTSASSSPTLFASLGSNTFFYASDGKHGTEPWITDETESGTAMIKDINKFQVSGAWTKNGINVSGTLFFVGYDGKEEVWKSDGTATGTKKVSNFNNSSNGNFHSFVELNSQLIFARNFELFKTDGNAVYSLNLYTGTFDVIKSSGKLFYLTSLPHALQVTDATIGNTTRLCDTVYNTPPVDVNGTVFFSGYSAAQGYELWKSDGTRAGTSIVKDINPGSGSFNIFEMVNVNGVLYFIGSSQGMSQLWKSDGTSGGTTLVKAGLSANGLYNHNGNLFFVGWNSSTGSELWKSDGTANGTGLVKDIYPGNNDGLDQYGKVKFTSVNAILYFRASTALEGLELWKSDGTEAGTTIVKDIYKGIKSSSPDYLKNVGGFLCFAAKDSAHGNELWVTNGSITCTNPVSDIYPFLNGGEPGGSEPTNLTAVNNQLFFSVYDPYQGYSLYRYDPFLPANTNAIYTFVGNGDWNTATNWCANQVGPTNVPAGSEVIIDPAGECNQSGNLSTQVAGKISVRPGKVLNLNGNLINSGSITGTGTLNLRIGTSLISSSGTISPRLVLTSKRMILGSNLQLSSISLTGNSRLELGAFDLKVDTVMGNEANFIVTNGSGRVIQTIGSTAVKLHLGSDTGSYTPITIQHSAGATEYRARVGSGITNTTSNDSGNVNKTWFVNRSGTGGHAKFTLQWNQPAEQNAFDRTNAYIAQSHSCPQPPNCVDSYFDIQSRSAALGTGTGPFTMTRDSIINPRSFIVKSSNDISTFTGNGSWDDPSNWTIGIVPPTEITKGREIIINHQLGGECTFSGDLKLKKGGLLKVLPGKKLKVSGKLIVEGEQ